MSTQTPAPQITQQTPQPINFDDMLQSLVKYEASCGYEAQDLTTAEYERDSEFGSLTWPSGAKHELNEWSSRQLCRASGIPFGVFRKASEKLSQDMFKEFSPGMKDPQVKLALKNLGGAKSIVRGILPMDYPDIRNSQILRSFQNLGTPFEVESANWQDQKNPTILRTRLIFPAFNRFIQNDDMKIGLDITSSELGACPLQVNLLLFKEICKNGAIASYGRKPYFFFDYGGTLSVDLGDVFEAAMARATNDVDGFMLRVDEAAQTPITKAQAHVLLQSAVEKGALNKGVVLKTMGTLEKDGCNNVWDLVNALTAQARGFRDILRLKYETAAGSLLGLVFDRQKVEDEYAVEAREMPPLLAATN